MQVGLVPGHTVLDANTAPSAKGAQPTIFGPYMLQPNGWMDQDVTWYRGRPRPRRLCVGWVPSSPPHKGRRSPQLSAYVQVGLCPSSPILLRKGDSFRPMSIVAKRLHGSTRNLARSWPQPWPHCVRWGPSSPAPKEALPIFDPCLFWPNRWMDQGGTCHGGASRLC